MKMPNAKAEMTIEGLETGFIKNDRIPSIGICHLVFDINVC